MFSIKTITPILLLAGIAFNSSLLHAQSIPVCQQTNSDSDGDGWGWENNRSCRVTNTLTPTQALCIDSDGDGFGWDGTQTCTNITPPAATSNNNSSQCIDADGDGYGWDGVRTCIPESATPPPTTPPPGNQSFTAVDDFGSVQNGTAVINILANDRGNIDPTTVSTYIPESTSKGFVRIDRQTGVITYTPYGAAAGIDTYGYTVKNTDGVRSNVAIVTIKIDDTIPCVVQPPKNQTISLLLVGNSLMTDIQRRLKKLLDCGGYNSDMATSNPGGHWLFQHDENATTTSLIAKGYDLTLLQEQSTGITTNVPPYTVINSLKNKIESAGSVMGFYQTWGLQNREPVQTEEILSGYETIANHFNAPIIHIGRAWDYFYTSHSENPPFSLHFDYAHPTNEGRALIAYVLYAYLTGESPIGLYSFKLNVDDARLLQTVAWTSYLANR